MPSEEFFFVVEGGPGTIGDYIWRQSKKASMSIFTSVNLYIFLASDILENVDYKAIHKQAKLITKRK